MIFFDEIFIKRGVHIYMVWLWIAGYDISGIQEFIFKSNELKDNVSAFQN